MLEEGLIKKKAEYRDLTIKYINSHFYYPLIYSNKENVEYIKHIINIPSEVNFIKNLETYIKNNSDKINQKYEWWMFSKLDESLDDVYIPYFDNGEPKKFKPDFIFWLREKGSDGYRIIFVDPKGTTHASTINKVGGFNNIFKNKTFKKERYNVIVDLVLYNEDNPFNDGYYEHFWSNNIEDIFKCEE